MRISNANGTCMLRASPPLLPRGCDPVPAVRGEARRVATKWRMYNASACRCSAAYRLVKQRDAEKKGSGDRTPSEEDHGSTRTRMALLVRRVAGCFPARPVAMPNTPLWFSVLMSCVDG